MTIGILGALAEEVEQLKERLEDGSRVADVPFEIYRGLLEGHPVLIAQCGVGKVNAAMVTQLMVRLGAKAIIFTGVAGAIDPKLAVGDLVISTDAWQHDVDATTLGFEPGQIPYEPVRCWQADDALRGLASVAAAELEGVTVVEGRIASGDQFVADPQKVAWLRDAFGAVCAEMEGASVAQVCAKWELPFVIVRSISDTADHGAGVDFLEFTPLAAARARQVVLGILRGLEPSSSGC
jgi:adenosylhomocysteine nucleosidase